MAPLMGSLSGRPLSVLDELTARASHLRRSMPVYDTARYCFLVSEREWDSLCADLKQLQGWHGSRAVDESLPPEFLKSIEVHGVEVRRR